MTEQMIAYFSAEKNEALLFMIAGLAAIAVSAYLAFTGSAYRGMIYPLTAVALIQLAVGGGVFFRTEAQLAGLQSQLRDDPHGLQKTELARMATVMRNFNYYKALEIGLLAAGVILVLVWPGKQTLYAVGIGLIIQSALMLTLDLFAEQRGREYIAALQTFL
jgi:hypothetical protein